MSFAQLDGESDVDVNGQEKEEGAHELGQPVGPEGAPGAGALVGAADTVDQVGRKNEYNDEEDFDNDDYEYWLDEFSELASDNGHDIGWSKEGKTCDECHRIIRHCRWRLYPDKCGNCWRTTVKKDQMYPFNFFDSDETSNGYVKWLLGL